MKTSVIKELATLATGLLAFAAFPAWAQLSTSANGPYYATPSWDQKLTTNRFVILANWNSEAVLDRETGLVWERTPSTALFTGAVPQNTFGGVTAIERCVDLTVSGRRGWRVPSIQELTSLTDTTMSSPSLPAGHPFAVNVSTAPFADSNVFWTSTAYVNGFNTRALRTVNLSSGQLGAADTGNGVLKYRVWCVRGGSGNPEQ